MSVAGLVRFRTCQGGCGEVLEYHGYCAICEKFYQEFFVKEVEAMDLVRVGKKERFFDSLPRVRNEDFSYEPSRMRRAAENLAGFAFFIGSVAVTGLVAVGVVTVVRWIAAR